MISELCQKSSTTIFHEHALHVVAGADGGDEGSDLALSLRVAEFLLDLRLEPLAGRLLTDEVRGNQLWCHTMSVSLFNWLIH